ncbi:MAG: HAD-IB family hydrolase [Pseudonocardiaceae bacterium]
MPRRCDQDGHRDGHQDIRTEKVALTTRNGQGGAEANLVGVAVAEVAPTVAVPTDTTAAAFFDVDNTMMRGASIFYFAQGLAARKFFPAGALASITWQQLRFRVFGKELSVAEMRTSREQALSFVAGRSTQQFVELGEDIYDELMAHRIWSGTLALAQMHLDAGQRVWLVTATPVELATIIARRLELTGALGTVAEAVDGVYTGRLVGDILHGAAKAQAVRALAVEEGLDLERCTAYSDSANDIPMLSMVGTAVAVNPDPNLRETARARGWQIREFRAGRKAARTSVMGIGMAAGAVAARLAYQRRARP